MRLKCGLELIRLDRDRSMMKVVQPWGYIGDKCEIDVENEFVSIGM